MRRVCIVSHAAYPIIRQLSTGKDSVGGGGAEIQLVRLGEGLLREGYEVHFIVGDYGQARKVRIGKFIVHKAPLRYLGGSNIHVLSDWLRMYAVLKSIDASHVLIKLPRHLLLLVGIYARLNNRKLIFIGQIDTDVDPDYLKKHDGTLAYMFYRIGLKSVHHVVAQNKVQKAGFENIFHKNTSIIKNIASFDKCKPVRERKYILWVGNSLKKKQADVFIRLAEKLPHIPFKMIVSSADKVEEKKLRKLCEAMDNIEYYSDLPFGEMYSHYETALLFVSTSLREGFPNTFLQAWQCQMPVISLRLDPDGVISEYKLGLVSPSFDGLLKDVIHVYSDTELRDTYSRNGLKYIDENHSPEVVINKYIELIGH